MDPYLQRQKMPRNIKICVITFAVVFILTKMFYSSCFAQEENSGLHLNHRAFDKQEWNELINDSDFNYHPPKNAFANWLGDLLTSFLRSIFGKDFDYKIESFKWIEYFIYGVAIVVFLWFLIKLIKAEKGWLFYRSKHNAKLDTIFTEEELEGVNLDEAIANAIKAENYRLAVRYLFLSNLSKLNALKLIQWAPDKTNKDYFREIKNKGIAKLFQDNAAAFERIWYGEYVPDRELFDKLKENFKNFDRRLAQ